MNEALHCAANCCMGGVMAMKQPTLIVFDLDGTLTDSFELGRALFKRVFALLGYGEISDEMADSFNGPSADEVCRRMGIGEDRKALYNALIDEVETELVKTQGKVYPGTLEMLATLSRHATLSILTNGSPVYCETCLSEYGFAPYIALHAGFASGVSKAQRIAMWQRETGAQRVIVVGDRETDVLNARAAGACAVGVTYGMGTREELAGADVLCDTVHQMQQAILDILARDA